jgi:glutaredoxin-like YruB-family protein
MDNAPAVKIYSTSWCAYCGAVKEYLDKLKVPYSEINVEQDQAAMHYIMSKTGSAGVPQIEIGDQVILGFDRARIDQALKDKHLVS